MKKLSLTIVLAIAAILMTNCRKTDVQPLNGGTEPFGDFEMSLTAGNGDDGKSSIEGLDIHWQLGDKLHVVDSNDMHYLGYLTATAIGTPKTTATFKGFITQPTAGHRCKFYFVGNNDFDIDGDGNYLFDVHEQYGGLSIYIGNTGNDDYESGDWKGDFNDISNGLQLMKSINKIEVTPAMLDAHNFGDKIIRMRSMMAISHIDLQVNGTSMGGELTDSVTVSGAGCYSTGTLNIKTGALTPNTGNITLKKANNDYYMVLIPASQTEAGSNLALTFTATSRNNESVSITPKVAANTFYNKDEAKVVNMLPPGTLPGEFSVSASTKVHFSQGNLYYDNDAATDKKWNFESHQYDFRTYSDGTNVGTAVINGTSTTMETGDWGLFGWSTASTTYGMSTSTSNSDYSGSFVDWGGNTIYAGGVATTGWRTLSGGSEGEWLYLLNSRTGDKAPEITVSGTTYIDCRYAEVKVNGVNGLMVFPDVFTWPSDVAAKPTTFNTYSSGWNGVNYTVADFTKLQGAGVVFLPAAGLRYGTSLSYVGSGSYYWSSSCYGSFSAYYLYFDSGGINPQYNYDRYYGESVRLVR